MLNKTPQTWLWCDNFIYGHLIRRVNQFSYEYVNFSRDCIFKSVKPWNASGNHLMSKFGILQLDFYLDLIWSNNRQPKGGYKIIPRLSEELFLWIIDRGHLLVSRDQWDISGLSIFCRRHKGDCWSYQSLISSCKTKVNELIFFIGNKSLWSPLNCFLLVRLK